VHLEFLCETFCRSRCAALCQAGTLESWQTARSCSRLRPTPCSLLQAAIQSAASRRSRAAFPLQPSLRATVAALDERRKICCGAVVSAVLSGYVHCPRADALRTAHATTVGARPAITQRVCRARKANAFAQYQTSTPTRDNLRNRRSKNWRAFQVQANQVCLQN